MMLLKKDPAKQADRVRASLQESKDALAAARAELGTAFADGDVRASERARRKVAILEARIDGLGEALPIAEARVREAGLAAERARQAEEERRLREVRRLQAAAARRMDGAWKALAAAHAELELVVRDLSPAEASRVAQRSRHAHRAAAYHWAPDLCRSLGIEPISASNRRPLAEGADQ